MRTIKSMKMVDIEKSRNFELFSEEFLDNKILSSDEKGLIMFLQQHMLNKNTGERYLPLLLHDDDVVKIVNCSRPTLRKYYKSLQGKNLLRIEKTKEKDDKGRFITKKIFDMSVNSPAIDPNIDYSEYGEKEELDPRLEEYFNNNEGLQDKIQLMMLIYELLKNYDKNDKESYDEYVLLYNNLVNNILEEVQSVESSL